MIFLSKELNKIFTQRVDITNGWSKSNLFKRKLKDNFCAPQNRIITQVILKIKMVQRTLFNIFLKKS